MISGYSMATQNSTGENHADTKLIPAVIQSVLRKYKSIYIQDSQRISQRSDVESIPVAG
jgi:hypothetical protein